MILLDTNVLSELLRPRPAAQVVRWFDEQDPRSLGLTAITVAELLYGVALLPAGRRSDELLEAIVLTLEDDFEGRILAFDAPAAEAYAAIAAEREQAGRRMPIADAQIAAICLSTGSALATRNTKDFLGVGVLLADPWVV